MGAGTRTEADTRRRWRPKKTFGTLFVPGVEAVGATGLDRPTSPIQFGPSPRRAATQKKGTRRSPTGTARALSDVRPLPPGSINGKSLAAVSPFGRRPVPSKRSPSDSEPSPIERRQFVRRGRTCPPASSATRGLWRNGQGLWRKMGRQALSRKWNVTIVGDNGLSLRRPKWTKAWIPPALQRCS